MKTRAIIQSASAAMLACWFAADLAWGAAEVSEYVRHPATQIEGSLYVSDLEPLKSSKDAGRTRRDRDVFGRPLRVRGHLFEKGLGAYRKADAL